MFETTALIFSWPWVAFSLICVIALPIASGRDKKKRPQLAIDTGDQDEVALPEDPGLGEAEAFADDGFAEAEFESGEAADVEAEFEGFGEETNQ